jgi:hypothetical protein
VQFLLFNLMPPSDTRINYVEEFDLMSEESEPIQDWVANSTPSVNFYVPNSTDRPVNQRYHAEALVADPDIQQLICAAVMRIVLDYAFPEPAHTLCDIG